MNRMYKMALLAALGMISASAARSFTVNDLYLGFTSSSASSDLVLDLGQSSSIIGQTSVVDLSSQFDSSLSTFNSIFGSSSTGVNMGVLGGNNAFNNGSLFATQDRAGGAGNAATPGSTFTFGQTGAQLTADVNTIPSDTALPTAGTYAGDTSKLFTSLTKVGVAGNFATKSGINVNSALSSGIVYEDLWAEVGTTPHDTYEGYLTFNYNTDSLTFTGANVAVPEPTTYGLLGGAGLLVISLRNQFRRKNA